METVREGARPANSNTEPAAAEHIPAQALNARLAAVARAFAPKPFNPHPLFAGAHAQTIVSSMHYPRRKSFRPDRTLYESRLVEVEPGTSVLLHCRWQPRRRTAPTLLLLHGLEGSSDSLYILGTARKGFAEGFNVVAMNMRNCGGTEHLAATLYHSGMTDDIRHVLLEELAGREGLTDVFLVGFSMSGNMVLRLAGEYGADSPRRSRASRPSRPRSTSTPAPRRWSDAQTRSTAGASSGTCASACGARAVCAPANFRHAAPAPRAHHTRVRRALHGAARRLS